LESWANYRLTFSFWGAGRCKRFQKILKVFVAFYF
jgi:hypothetical protein